MLKIRVYRAVKKWNNDVEWITSQLKTSDDVFKWTQLVWQEIVMWIRIGDPTKPQEELDWLADRRGFSETQKAYLRSMMKHVWMWS